MGQAPGDATGRFVLHDHRRPRRHADLRLEENGVLRSWAVPRGLPQDPRQNRLAVHVPELPLRLPLVRLEVAPHGLEVRLRRRGADVAGCESPFDPVLRPAHRAVGEVERADGRDERREPAVSHRRPRRSVPPAR